MFCHHAEHLAGGFNLYFLAMHPYRWLTRSTALHRRDAGR